MDRLSFVAEVVKALAWPLTVLGIFLVLRRPLLGLFPLLARLKFKDLEVDFGGRLAEVSAEAASLRGARGEAPQAVDDALLGLAAAAPRAAILEAWLRLESAALDAARRRGTTEPVSHLRSPMRLIEALEEQR